MTTDTPLLAQKSPYSIRMVNGEPFFFIPVTHKTEATLPTFDPAIDYETLCQEMNLRKAQATQQLQALILEYKNLTSKLERLQAQGNVEPSGGLNKRKRHRRAADEIERHFTCQVCGKAYGSEGSLNQHSKLKHPD